MSDYSDVDYSSESDAEQGLEEEYEAAKQLAQEGNVADAIDALKTIIELDVEKSKWGFKACKRLVKLAMQRERAADEPRLLLEYYRKLFPFITSKGISANDADKALDSLWSRYCCSEEVEFSAKHQYCLLTWRHLGTRCSRITRLKWAARLSNHCVTDHDYADIEETSDELELEQFVDEGMNFEDTESFVQSVFDTHLLVAHLNFRDELYKHVDIRLKRLEDTARKMDVPGESRGVLKELNARISVVTGQFGKASKQLRELLDEKAFVAVHPARYSRICTQLRLLAQLVPSSPVFHEELEDIVDRLIGCYRTNDKPGLLAAMDGIAQDDDSSAVLDICDALVRNMTSRRVPADAWIDVFACLDRYDIDSFVLVSRRISTFVVANAHRLPLRVITDVCVLGEITRDFFPKDVQRITRTGNPFRHLSEQQRAEAVVYKIRMSADNAITTKRRKFVYDHLADLHGDVWPLIASEPPFVSFLRCALAHSVVERFDLLGAIPLWSVGTQEASVRPRVYIQRLNYVFDTKSDLHFTGALHMLPRLGATRVEELTMDTRKWDDGDDSSFLMPLSALNVTKLVCKWKHFFQTEFCRTAFLRYCFSVGHSPASRHIVVRDLWVRPDNLTRFLLQLEEEARNSTFKKDVRLEIRLSERAYVDAHSAPLNIRQTDEYVWETNRLHIELEKYELTARYSWHGNDENNGRPLKRRRLE